MKIDLTTEPLGQGKDGKPVYLKDIWPTTEEIAGAAAQGRSASDMFAKRYGDVFKGDKHWQGIKVAGGQTYAWDIGSTYVQNPPYFEGMTMTPEPVTDIIEARVLGIFGDSITTDHISPGRHHPQDLARRRVPAASTRSARPTSTPTARGAATTR